MSYIKFGIRRCDKIDTDTVNSDQEQKGIGFIFGRRGTEILSCPFRYTIPVIYFYTTIPNIKMVLKRGLDFDFNVGTLLKHYTTLDNNTILAIKEGKFRTQLVIDRCISYKYKRNKIYEEY